MRPFPLRLRSEVDVPAAEPEPKADEPGTETGEPVPAVEPKPAKKPRAPRKHKEEFAPDYLVDDLEAKLSEVTIYTDGSCRFNPGPGGWAAVLLAQTKKGPAEKRVSGGKEESTNQEMELTAVKEALSLLKTPAGSPCTLTPAMSSTRLRKDGWKAGSRRTGRREAASPTWSCAGGRPAASAAQDQLYLGQGPCGHCLQQHL